MGEFKHVKPLDQPIDEGIGGVGDRRIREQADDQTGDMSGDPQRGGRSAANEREEGEEPRPADESAHDSIPSRSFNL